MLDKETKNRIADFFSKEDLIELLEVTVDDVIDAFEPEIEEALDDLNDIMGVSEDDA
jgi:hypothetical protein